MKPSRVRQALDPDAARLPLAGGLLLFVPIALLGNAIGSTLRYPEIGSAVLFPPYAALTAVLVASPRRHWIWYILTGSIAHLTTHWPHWSLSWVLLADVANVMRALTAAVALRWVFGGAPRLASIRGLALFVLCAVLVAPAVGAVIGAANVMIHGASDSYWRPWTAWFVSNALTGLAMLPAFLALFAVAGRGRLRIERRALAEAVLLAATLGVTCVIAFLQGSFDRRYLVLLLYTPLPALIWAALRFGSAPALPPLIGDRVQLQQLLLNLILNGCEAMTAATNRRLLLRADAAAAGDVHIVIRDSGPGIPEALLERLFEPFVTTKPEGLGLGLSISRTIVAAHGGRLWAENNPEGGASMHCLLAVTTPGGAAAVPQPLAIAGS